MPSIDKHPAGSFAWLELATTDQAAAKNFYSKLFDWEWKDVPIGPEESYTMFSLDGRPTGAAFQMSAEESGAGIPAHWQIYIAVDDADAACAHAVELGGRTIHAPMDVSNFGRMAVLEDPTGAIFSMWEAHEHKGLCVGCEPGALCWADLQTRDRDEAMRFYGSLFGWEFTMGRGVDPEGYLHIRNGDRFIGGMPPAQTLSPGLPPHWLPYLQVRECETHTAKAAALGATTLMGATAIEGSGHFSVVADPQGAVFALFAPGS